MKRKRPAEGLEERGSIVPQILPRVKRGTVHSTLRLRETSVPKPGRNVHRLRAFYRAIVPDNTVSLGRFVFLPNFRFMCVHICISLSLLTNADFGALVPLSLSLFMRCLQIQATSFPDVHVKRFTDCGRYLVCFSRNFIKYFISVLF